MNEFPPAEILREHRGLLLACEAIGWLHMAGKARADFLRHQGGLQTQYDYIKWHTLENPPFPWDDLLGWLKDAYSDYVAHWPKSFADFTEKHAQRSVGLLGLLQAGHAMASGIEKQSYDNNSVAYLKQDASQMWRSSAFGRPERNLLAEPPEMLTEAGWRRLVGEMKRILVELKELALQRKADPEPWARWRERAIGEASFLRRAFLSTLAETRLPNNDVTLWDQSYVAAALFKSAAAGGILDNNFSDAFWKKVQKIEYKVRWRLLTVGIGVDHYEARAVKIGDWTGTRAVIQEFFEQVRRFIEVDLGIGAQVYRDASVAVFTFPGELASNASSSGKPQAEMAEWLKGWEAWLQTQVDGLAQQLRLETPPVVQLSRPTRSLVPMVRERREVAKKLAIPVHRPWFVQGETAKAKESRHVCPVCKVRPSGNVGQKGQPCAVCAQRRHHRLQDWFQNRLGTDTIWLTELADTHRRVALLTFQLGIDPWLEGKRIDSLRSQAIAEWRRHNPAFSYKRKNEEIHVPNPVHSASSFSDLQDVFRSKLEKPEIPSKKEKFDEKDWVIGSLNTGYQHSKSWDQFFNSIVEDRADAPCFAALSRQEQAHWLVHQLFRKLPSPGRVYRFWREAENFFQALLKAFRQIAARHPNRWRVQRLLLVPDPETRSCWQEGQLYEGRWRNEPITLVFHQEGFLTVFNLARCLRPEERSSSLYEEMKREGIELRATDAFMDSHPLTLRPVNVRDVSPSLGHLGTYHPVIPLEISPLRFRVLLPLEAASECVDVALARWQDTFSRVQDRLPLQVGVVGFPVNTAFQAALEMGRSLETVLGEERCETWRVRAAGSRDGVAALSLRRSDREDELWTFPVSLPDGRKDVFYSYVEVEDRRLRFPLDFQHPEGQVYRHVEDLRPGDGIYVRPGRVAAVFLDTTARRFETPDVRYLADWQKMRRVWKVLKDSSSSVGRLRLLRERLWRYAVDWDIRCDGQAKAAWLHMVRASLQEALDVQDAMLEELLDAARTGVLLWALDWHLHILKERG